MTEEKRRGRPKLTFKEIRQQHGHETDPTDPKARSRYRRHLDNLSAAGVKLEDANISDVGRGTAAKAAMFYVELIGDKATVPVDQTTTIVHRSAEEAAASILEQLGQKRKEAAQPAEKSETIQ
jgi:hypothetical protein